MASALPPKAVQRLKEAARAPANQRAQAVDEAIDWVQRNFPNHFKTPNKPRSTAP